jgi:hypothetical protein
LSGENDDTGHHQPAILYKGEVKLNVAMKLLRDSDGEVTPCPSSSIA